MITTLWYAIWWKPFCDGNLCSGPKARNIIVVCRVFRFLDIWILEYYRTLGFFKMKTCNKKYQKWYTIDRSMICSFTPLPLAEKVTPCVIVIHNYFRNKSFGLTEVICQSNGSRAVAILHNLATTHLTKGRHAAQFLIICMLISDGTIHSWLEQVLQYGKDIRHVCN